MHFTMVAGHFLNLARQVLQFVGHGIDPGFGLVDIRAGDKGRVRFRAQDMSAGAVAMSSALVSETGNAVVAQEHLDRMTSILPSAGGETVFETRGSELRVVCGRLRLAMPVRAADEFPDFPRPGPLTWFPVKNGDLSRVVEHLLWAVCRDDSRPALAGVHLTPQCSEASDGFVMAHLCPGIVTAGQVVVPGDVWSKLRFFVAPDDRDVNMALEPNRVHFKTSSWLVSASLISSSYPQTRGWVYEPDADGNHFMGQKVMKVHWIFVNRHEALEVLRRVSGASVTKDEEKLGATMRMNVDEKGELHFIAHGQTLAVDDVVGWAEGSVQAQDLSPFLALGRLGISAPGARSALSHLKSDVVKIMWAGDGDSVQFHDESEGLAMVTMPRVI